MFARWATAMLGRDKTSGQRMGSGVWRRLGSTINQSCLLLLHMRLPGAVIRVASACLPSWPPTLGPCDDTSLTLRETRQLRATRMTEQMPTPGTQRPAQHPASSRLVPRGSWHACMRRPACWLTPCPTSTLLARVYTYIHSRWSFALERFTQAVDWRTR